MARRSIAIEATTSGDTLMTDEDTTSMNKESQSQQLSQTHSDQGYYSGPASYPSPKERTSDDDSHQSSSLNILGSKAKQLVNAVNKLEQAGIEASGLPLPKIVAVGDQSAGKSSLIEAISGIKVPRAAGTCTRCPLQISLVQDPEPSWKVTVHRKYHYVPNARDAPHGSASDDFGSWKLLGRPEDVASRSLTNADEVENAIYNAQAAVLSPSEDPMKILYGTKPLRPVEFSPNVVKIDITGPTIPTLTLYDLPGIIAQAQNDDATLPHMINVLAEQHIKNDNTIVMLACPIGSDYQNSNAAALVKRLHAQDRCIGVITKPDRLSFDDGTQWANLLAGNEFFKMGYGYFVTKQPAPEELKVGITHEEARRREKLFFEKDKRWNAPAFLPFRRRFGTFQLQTRLSELLANEIARGLPEIERTIDEELAGLEMKLAEYPIPHESPINEVFDIVGKIRQLVQEVMIGEFPHNKLILLWRDMAGEYKKQLSDMKPVVVVNTDPEAQWSVSSTEPISLDSDDDDENESTPVSAPASGSKRSMPPPSTPTKRQRQTSVRRNGTAPKKEDNLYTLTNRPKEHACRFTLEGIRATVRDRSTSGLPNVSDPRAVDAMIAESTMHWKTPLLNFLRSMRNVVHDIVDTVAGQALRSRKSTPLAAETFQAIHEFLDCTHKSLEMNCLRYLESERYKPTTFNEEVLTFYRKQELEHIRYHRKLARGKCYLAVKDSSNHTRRSEVPKREMKRIETVKPEDMGEDPFSAEVEVMARIRGYYSTAAGTLVDMVCKSMQYDVFDKCQRELAIDLKNKLGVNDGNVLETCRRLLTEDPAREATRLALESEKKKLLGAKRTLREIHA